VALAAAWGLALAVPGGARALRGAEIAGELAPGPPEEDRRAMAEGLFAEALARTDPPTEEGLRRALELFAETLPRWTELGEVGRQAETLNEMGILLRRLGETADAIELYGQALGLFRRAGDLVGEAQTLNNRGVAWVELEELGRAEEDYRAAIALWQELEDPLEEARTLRGLGQMLLRRGDNAGALECFERALGLARQGESRDPFGEGASLNQIGRCQLALGETREAARSFKAALALAREAGGSDLEAAALIHLGHVDRREGDLRSALDHFLAGLDLLRQRGEPAYLAAALQNLATLHVELGELRRALDLYGEALELYRKVGNPGAAALVSLSVAWIRVAQGETGPAIAELAALLAERRAAGDDKLAAEVLRALGTAHLAAGQPKQAREALEAALSWWREKGDRARETSTLGELGAAWAALGETSKAEAVYHEALESSRASGDRSVEAQSLSGLARVERDRGNLEPARELAEEALTILEEQRNRVPTPELRATFLAHKQDYYELRLDVLIRLHDRHPGEGWDIAAFEASEQARARGLLDLLAERGDGSGDGSGDEGELGEVDLAARERAIAVRLNQIQGELAGLAAGPSSRRTELLRQLSEAEEARERLELEIRREHPRYSEARYGEPAGLPELQAALGPGTALVEYALGEEEALLFVVTRERVQSFRLQAQSAEIAKEVGKVREAITTPGRRTFGAFRRAAWSLYHILLAPAATMLADVDRLLIVPDASLHYLPFEALLTAPPEAGPGPDGAWPYLLGRFSVSYVPSASVLVSLARAGPADRTEAGTGRLDLVAFADPHYGAGPGALPRLSGSAREVAGIAALYPPGETLLYLGEEAREGNVEGARVHRARRLHFATHGLLDERRPQRSALALTPGGEGEDGLLQVWEIFHLHLTAELVVLSACETALGDEVRGEGLVGLSRAFLYAGSPRVVVSLWRVDDEATAELMVRFYRDLGSEASAADALRQAKLALLRDPRFTHPSHWASFILSGRP